MTERFLIYIPDPFGVGASQYAIATRSDLELIPIENISEDDEFIAFEAATLVDDLRRQSAPLPKCIVDISEALRLSVGISKADGGEQKWNFWKRIKPKFDTATAWRLARDVFEGRILRPEPEALVILLGSLANALVKLWDDLTNLLHEQGEYQRFFEIEVPVAQIFYNRLYSGVAVNAAAISSALEAANAVKYSTYRQVADQLDVSPTGLNYWNVNALLSKTDAPEIGEEIEGYSLRQQLKLATETSNFAKTFTGLQDASRDVSVLTRLADTEGRIFPIFHCCGTITSRILVSDPYLQELRKKYRTAISADDGYELSYLDYSQFEPGIMAALSNDEQLISLYNEGDVYASLSIALYGNENHRNLCKKIFLAFSYGMSIQGIVWLLTKKGATELERNSLEERVSAFFEIFAALSTFKSSSADALEEKGRIETVLGNHRKRVRTGPLEAKEKRWAVSQVIQGTASLIFKKALIGLHHKFGANAIVLPMHDAVLMQFTPPLLAESTAAAVSIMEAAFTEVCPQVRCRVSTGPFAAD